MTKEVISRMPSKVMFVLDSLKADYKSPYMSKDETRARLAGYVLGLRDAGLISDRERQILFVYATV